MVYDVVKSARIGGRAALLFFIVSVAGCVTLPSADRPEPERETQKQRIVVSILRPPAQITPFVNKAVTDEIETLKKSPYSVEKWLAAAERFSPLMKGVLRAHGVPEDLIYVAILESGFDPTVVSVKGAGGPWQFIPATAGGFGMEMDEWVDERRDYEKSTIVAARYFSSLYSSFSNWELALAGYNCGGGSVNAAIKACGSVNLWEMGTMGRLSFQARGYVPRVLALILIMKEPEKYGFARPTGVVPFTYDKVYVPGGLPLWFFARFLGTTEKTMAALNPELIRGVTPPGANDYELKIPTGKKPLFLEKFAEAYERYGDDLIRQGEIKKRPPR
ncbi:MAG: lytic transglycosylase domain-containing protein [Deltaproteobacteria bacterium]|nr:lytic transglycosylase domain-containing protein [Candidatus Zymogenaceae bacterium]